MKKLFAIVALVAACTFGATSSLRAQEDVAEATEQVDTAAVDSAAVDTTAEEETVAETPENTEVK